MHAEANTNIKYQAIPNMFYRERAKQHLFYPQMLNLRIVVDCETNTQGFMAGAVKV